jgi:hypothetical protein
MKSPREVKRNQGQTIARAGMPAVTGAASRIQGNPSCGLTADQTDTGYRAKKSKPSLAPPPFFI